MDFMQEKQDVWGERKKQQKTAHLLTCHLVLAAHGAVDVAACLPMAMEQLHYLLVNSSVRRGLCIAWWKEEPDKF